MKTKAILVAAAVITAAIPIVLVVRSTDESTAPATAASPQAGIPVPASPRIPPGNTQANVWSRIKNDPDRLNEVVEQTTAAAKRILEAMQQAYRLRITAWQEKQRIITDPHISETERELTQKEANDDATQAKVQEREMAEYRQRMEAYLMATKGTPGEAGATISDVVAKCARESLQSLYIGNESSETEAPALRMLWEKRARALRTGEIEEAESIGPKMIELEPDSTMGYIAVMQTMLHLGEKDDAKKFLSLSKERFPVATELHYFSGQLAFISGDYKAAQEIFEEIGEALASDEERVFARVKDQARLIELLQHDPDIQALLHRDFTDIPPVEYMQFERRMAQEFGDPIVVDAWDDAIRNFGSLQAPEPEPSVSSSSEGHHGLRDSSAEIIVCDQ